MIEDFIRARGYLTLGSRLKRLGETLQADVQALTRQEGMQVAAGLLPSIAVLHQHGSLTVGELAEALRISQPGATRNILRLTRQGLVENAPRKGDRRVKAVALTRKCEALYRRSAGDLWPRIERAVTRLCAKLDGNLLQQLSQLEDGLARRPLRVRAMKPRRGQS